MADPKYMAGRVLAFLGGWLLVFVVVSFGFWGFVLCGSLS